MPDGLVRLRYGYVVKCTGFEKDAQGKVTVVYCDYLPDTKSGTPGADAIKVKGNIHWVSAAHAYECEVRLYDRLFSEAHPGQSIDGVDVDYLTQLYPNSAKKITAQLEPSLKDAKPEDRFQFERHGYFVADRKDSVAGKPVFNRTVTLRDAWQK
jgi:glutaminyl-tRNA synthetase